MNQKRYTYQAKILTLRILEQNDFIFLRTEKMTGIRRQTIKVWAEIYGNEVFSGKSPVEQALEVIDRELKQNDLEILITASTALMVTMQRIITIVDSEKNLVRLAKVLKILHEITNDMEQSGRYNFKHPDYCSGLTPTNDFNVAMRPR